MAAPLPAPTGTHQKLHHDTLILGAGVSGLACAARLLKAGHQPHLLEARARIGGRVASVHLEGCRLDTGANWVHGIGTAEQPNPLLGILPEQRWRHMNDAVMFSPAESATKVASVVSGETAERIQELYYDVVEDVQEMAASLPLKEARNTSVLEALRRSKVLPDAYKALPKEHRHTLGLMFQGIENMEAGPLSSSTSEPARPEGKSGLSLLEYASDDFDGDDAFLLDGYTPVVNEIAAPLLEAHAISLKTIVERIDWSADTIVVHTNRAKYTTKHLVCTFPLGVLKDHAQQLFKPALPTATLKAIGRLGFGTLNKIFVVYSSAWWTEEPYLSVINAGQKDNSAPPDFFIGFTPHLSGVSIGPDGAMLPDMYRLPALNLHALTGQPALAAFVCCKSAVDVESMTDFEAGNLFHRALTQWFGSSNEPPRPKAVHVTRWASDPFSKGSYSHMITGPSEPENREIIKQPLLSGFGATLRFAGEHCHKDHFGTVHGALLDGQRVADAILSENKNSR